MKLYFSSLRHVEDLNEVLFSHIHTRVYAGLWRKRVTIDENVSVRERARARTYLQKINDWCR